MANPSPHQPDNRTNHPPGQSASLPGSPYVRVRPAIPSRSPPRTPQVPSSRPYVQSQLSDGGCQFHQPLKITRRMSYSLGNEPLPPADGPVPEELEENVRSRLDAACTDLWHRLLPSDQVVDRRTLFLDKLEGRLKTKWPDHKLKLDVFGSTANDLSTADSDVDICLTMDPGKKLTTCTLARYLHSLGMNNIVCIPSAKVPIVKMFDPVLQFACDIGINNSAAIDNTRMIKAYTKIDRRVRPLAMIVKYWTRRRVLNDSATGLTLSSYTWINMIINFLQVIRPPILPSMQEPRARDHPERKIAVKGLYNDESWWTHHYGMANTSTLGQLLFRFFRYYGHKFDWENDIVSIRKGATIPKVDKRWDLLQNNRLCVEEPFNIDRNLANTAEDTSIKGIQMELRRGFEILSTSASLEQLCEQYTAPPPKVYQPNLRQNFRARNFAPDTLAQPMAITRSNSQGRSAFERGGGRSRGGRRSSTITDPPPSARRASSSAAYDPNGDGKTDAHPFLDMSQTAAEIARIRVDQRVAADLLMLEKQKEIAAARMATLSSQLPPHLSRLPRDADADRQHHRNDSTHHRSDSMDLPGSAPLRQSFSNGQYDPRMHHPRSGGRTRQNSGLSNNYPLYGPRNARYPNQVYQDPYRPGHLNRSRSQPPHTGAIPYSPTMSLLPNGQIITHPPIPLIDPEALMGYQNGSHKSIRNKTRPRWGYHLDHLGVEYLGYLHQQAQQAAVAANAGLPPLTPTAIPLAYPLSGLEGPYGSDSRGDYPPTSAFTTPSTRSRPVTPPTTAPLPSSAQTPLESSISTLHSERSSWSNLGRPYVPQQSDLGRSISVQHFEQLHAPERIGTRSWNGSPEHLASDLSGSDRPVLASQSEMSDMSTRRLTDSTVSCQTDLEYANGMSSGAVSLQELVGAQGKPLPMPISPPSVKTSQPLSPVAEQTPPRASPLADLPTRVSPPRLSMSFRDSVLRRTSAASTTGDSKSSVTSPPPPPLSLGDSLVQRASLAEAIRSSAGTSKLTPVRETITPSLAATASAVPLQASVANGQVAHPTLSSIKSSSSLSNGKSSVPRWGTGDQPATLAQHLRNMEKGSQAPRQQKQNPPRQAGEQQPPPTPGPETKPTKPGLPPDSSAGPPLPTAAARATPLPPSKSQITVPAMPPPQNRSPYYISRAPPAVSPSSHRRTMSEGFEGAKWAVNVAIKYPPSPASIEFFEKHKPPVTRRAVANGTDGEVDKVDGGEEGKVARGEKVERVKTNGHTPHMPSIPHSVSVDPQVWTEMRSKARTNGAEASNGSVTGKRKGGMNSSEPNGVVGGKIWHHHRHARAESAVNGTEGKTARAAKAGNGEARPDKETDRKGG